MTVLYILVPVEPFTEGMMDGDLWKAAYPFYSLQDAMQHYILNKGVLELINPRWDIIQVFAIQ